MFSKWHLKVMVMLTLFSAKVIRGENVSFELLKGDENVPVPGQEELYTFLDIGNELWHRSLRACSLANGPHIAQVQGINFLEKPMTFKTVSFSETFHRHYSP